MKKLALVIWLALVLPTKVGAQEYEVTSFSSRIEILRNTDLRITETIEANFNIPKHGIFRYIPSKYKVEGKTWDTHLRVERVNERYTLTHEGNNVVIKIGDPNVTSTGPKTYEITYVVENMVLDFSNHDEVYWNVTGADWDTTIDKASVQVVTPWAKIIKSDCFAGVSGTSDRSCRTVGDSWTAGGLGEGKEMTIVVGLDKENLLEWPGWWDRNWREIGKYLLSLAPALIMGSIWYVRGRDLKYIGSNVYVKQEAAIVRKTGVGEREHLPLVYSPIAGLTPAEVGTIIDQRVDLADVTAEILELARLGYVKIKKVDKDYLFERTDKNDEALKDFQKSLLTNITDSVRFAPDVGSTSRQTSLAKMKQKFSKSLDEFKDKLYEHLASARIFDGRPDNIRRIVVGIGAFAGWMTIGIFGAVVLAQGPWGVVLLVSSAIAGVFAYQLPRRTAWGHSLYRQTVGLKYFLGKGKWRYEVAEKYLFLEEVFPLAVSLGVVSKLVSDMKGLGLAAPEYVGGFGGNIGSFHSQISSTLPSVKSGGSGGWSGGSGFSGGSSGGGGGGGGGGSW
ncbi:hypothetical protein A2634_03230 [Candidatus Amesbacteria bacterium RIFCSPHIGHO2_01_FULL_48_32]|uniref:DUF2207 domain-containing protein n=1 Tax=Candidatus Amesbacteria bacterium RIFCSPLOWO2_01_FULL_48_25 TaxID=1797259 RepID=A0A1F4ZB17_9BACT|nr:MAG: hypothetical protein A2634_03230 [Candidatus Amesbacteria bacterium RIFCSPHIGHO2_01_FULL_48_32]OGD03579.1 MAG: hypothetical protein A2989_02760 [Candidatus Amesbacteria bacterium RIFCSPLOWO2_01_FULL_48_25]HJZ04677.1 DUF2207 domain-containing protein [Patescibacteria group bacterium]